MKRLHAVLAGAVLALAASGCSSSNAGSSSSGTTGTTSHTTGATGSSSGSTGSTGASSGSSTSSGSTSGSSGSGTGSTGSSGSSGSSGSTGSTGSSGSSGSSGSTGASYGPATVVIVSNDPFDPVVDGGTVVTLTEDQSWAPADNSVYGALVPFGDGGYGVLTGAPSADGGEFDIPGAPDSGAIFVHQFRQYTETAARTVDFGYQTPGRADVTTFADPNAPQPTDVKLTITGLAPLQNQDEFELVAANDLGFADYTLQNTLTDDAGNPAWVDGGTSLSGHVDWGTEVLNAWSPSGPIPEIQGGVDPVFGVELNEDMHVGPSTLRSWSATHFVDLTGLNVTEGVATQQSATAIAITGQQIYTVTGTRPTALEADLPTGATFGSLGYDIFVSPSAAAPGVPYFGYADLGYGNETGNTLAATPNLASPFPPNWPVGGWVSVGYSVPVEVSASPVVNYNVSVGFATNQVLSGHTLGYSATLGAVRNLKVDGQAASANVNAASSTPTISWTAPAVGTPTAYIIRAKQLTVSGTSATAHSRGAVRVLPTTTSFTYPAGVLPSGSYVFVVIAENSDADYAAQPYYAPSHSEVATTATHLVTVP